MATQTKENYLKAIYFLQLKNEAVTLTELGKEMNVSKPTVNNMIKKLTSKGWLKYEKYKPITLTKAGSKQAALIVRKHRLTEMFLVQIMGFGWEEVHDIAEEMEHLKTPQFFDRMDEILGYPTVDPHGSPIPDKTGKVSSKKYENLSNIPVGTAARLAAVRDTSVALLELLNSKQIKLGTTFYIHRIEAFDQTMVVDTENVKQIHLSNEVAKRLMVEVVK